MPARAFVGTAGWSVPRAHASRFPAEGSHLQRYARVMNAVEINSSFYRPHRRDTYARWAASVPAGLRFAVKVPKRMTHEAGLADCGPAIAQFAAEVAGLGAALRIVLVQLPPSHVFAAAVAAAFFRDLAAALPAVVVCEPRHASWFAPDVGHRLADLGIVRAAADPACVPAAAAPGGADTLIYRRLHGSPKLYYSDYDETFLADVGAAIAADRAAGRESWCIFDNTAAFAALGNALSVRDALV